MGTAGPRILGRYEIQEEIGRGMMGVVYRAKDPALGRTVALKTVSLLLAVPDDERAAFEQRFLNEARVAAGLNHPGIVVVHDVGRDVESNSLYIALEYLEGETLAERLKRQGLVEWREALRLTARLADALHHAHGSHIVHRDVKPANIMVLPSGLPKLMDFGIAKIPAAQLTSAGEFFGTPSYMSPEQATGEPLDARSDVFSLGIVFFEMLTGQKPFLGSSEMSILETVRECRVAPPTTLNPRIPEKMERVAMKALERDPEVRYQDAGEMHRDLERVLHERQPPTPRDVTLLLEQLFDEPERGGAVSADWSADRPSSVHGDPDRGFAAPPPAAGKQAGAKDPMSIQKLLKRFGIK